MKSLKDAIEEFATDLATKAEEVTAAANEFHSQGMITTSDLEQVAEEIAGACPHNAQSLLERAVARHLISKDLQDDTLLFVSNPNIFPLKQVMGGE